MKRHHLKTWPPYFQQIVDGNKTFDIRVNDRGFQPGDFLRLEEYLPDTKEYTGRFTVRMIGFMIEGEWGLPPGTCCMSLLAMKGEWWNDDDL